MRSFVAILLLAACTDPVVEMQLILPKNASSFDTSCITAVEVRVTGNNFLQDPDDYERSCIELAGGNSYEAIREAIRGKFDVSVPDSGITGIEIYGWSGPNPCKTAAENDPFYSPDLLFMGRGAYFGEDLVDVTIIPNLSCTKSQINARVVDMFALASGATCQQAANVGAAGVGVGTMVPRLYGRGSRLFGNLQGANVVGNLASFMGPTTVGPKACLALDTGDEALGGAIECVIGGPSVCAGAGETEVASVPYAITANTANYDATLMAKYPGLVYGSVWSSGTTKAPVAGATVTVDAAHGKVVYLDPPNAAGVIVPRADQSATGPSGLFALYTDTLVSTKIAANGVTRTVVLGAINESPAGALVVVGP
jgi:hypothetical protein